MRPFENFVITHYVVGIMMQLDKQGNYNPWKQPQYGFSANDTKVTPPDNYEIRPQGESIEKGDIVYDVYAGWIDGFEQHHVDNGKIAISNGRWTTWAKAL